jgi:histidine triad (HIT) family protein
MAYDPNNIFARILRGEIPAHRVFEDAHTLVIPKAHAEDLFDLAPDALAATILTTQRVARAVKKAFDVPGILIAQLNGSAAGQSVFHIHFHILPRREGFDLKLHAREMADPAVLADHAARVRAALDN